MSGIADLFRALWALLPHELVIALGVVTALALVPLWVQSIKDKQIRGLARRMVRAEATEREGLARDVLRLAGSSRERLRTAALSAIQYDQRALEAQALERLEPLDREWVQKTRERRARPKSRFRDPIEARVRIEALLDQGLVAAAEEQLAEASAAFPNDAELQALSGRRR